MKNVEPATKQDIQNLTHDVEILKMQVQELVQTTKKEIHDLAGLINDLMRMMNDRFDRLESKTKLQEVVIIDHETRIGRIELAA